MWATVFSLLGSLSFLFFLFSLSFEAIISLKAQEVERI